MRRLALLFALLALLALLFARPRPCPGLELTSSRRGRLPRQGRRAGSSR